MLDTTQRRTVTLREERHCRVLSEGETGAFPDSSGLDDRRRQVLGIRTEICGAECRERDSGTKELVWLCLKTLAVDWATYAQSKAR